MINIKKVTVELSSNGIDKLISKLQQLDKNLDNANNDIVKEMSTFVKNKVAKNLADTPYKDGNNASYAYEEVSGKSAKAGMRGHQSAYNEFGTGTVGKNSPHPIKGEFALNDYNSGKTIRTNKRKTSNATENGIPINGKYWTYQGPNGKVYTQGIPAGKQVYNAMLALRKKKSEIIKQKVGEALSKL